MSNGYILCSSLLGVPIIFIEEVHRQFHCWNLLRRHLEPALGSHQEAFHQKRRSRGLHWSADQWAQPLVTAFVLEAPMKVPFIMPRAKPLIRRFASLVGPPIHVMTVWRHVIGRHFCLLDQRVWLPFIFWPKTRTNKILRGHVNLIHYLMSVRNTSSSIYFDIIDAQNWSLLSINTLLLLLLLKWSHLLHGNGFWNPERKTYK